MSSPGLSMGGLPKDLVLASRFTLSALTTSTVNSLAHHQYLRMTCHHSSLTGAPYTTSQEPSVILPLLPRHLHVWFPGLILGSLVRLLLLRLVRVRLQLFCLLRVCQEMTFRPLLLPGSLYRLPLLRLVQVLLLLFRLL